MKHPCNLCNHKSTSAVVEGSPDVPVLVENHEFIGVGHHASNVDAHFLNLFFVLRADVQKDVL